MLRYMGFIWNALSPSQSEATRTLTRRLRAASDCWRSAIDSNGLSVLVDETRRDLSEVCCLSGGAGVVLGTLFERTADGNGTMRRVGALSSNQTAVVVATGGRDLVASYWGRYVAFIQGAQANRTWIVKDPRGGLPCFRTEWCGVTIFFSTIEDCLRLGLLTFSVNWRYMRARIAAGLFHSDQTALHEVSEVHAGECVELADDRSSKTFYWHPHDILRSNSIEDPLQAARELRTTAKSCMHAWASCHQSILHRLSGGLDSSIVLGCLQDAPARPQITCLHIYDSKTGLTDERFYARLAAERASCELIEREREPAAICFDQLLLGQPSVNPWPHLAHLETNAWEGGVSRERNATAIFCGEGGDSIFCRYSKELAVTDYVLRHGLGPRAVALAANIAPLVHSSVWKILSDALRDWLLGNRVDHDLEAMSYRKLVRKEVQASVVSDAMYVHSWFQPTGELPPGKLLHIRLVLYTDGFYYVPFGSRDHPEELHPLQSQPLVELCLRIPTYVHCDGRWDRALARRAFSPDVPPEILRRRWKARAGGIAEAVLMRNLSIARELLLDGILVGEGLLDRRGVEQALSKRLSKNAGMTMEVFDHLLTETWLRRWAALGQRVAA